MECAWNICGFQPMQSKAYLCNASHIKLIHPGKEQQKDRFVSLVQNH